MSCEVNFVWNYVNNLCYEHLKRTGKFFSAYDICEYTKGATLEGLDISAATVQCINMKYFENRLTNKKAKLAWRKSIGSRKSLGWIPFRNKAIRLKDHKIKYQNRLYSIIDTYDLSKYNIRSGSFNEDSRGRWYINICVETKDKIHPTYNGFNAIGIDLGLKDFLTCSDGLKFESQKHYRNLEPKLQIAQRANKKNRTRAIHAKIKNQRNDFHHKLSTQLVTENSAIFVGNVNASKLAKTKMAKSVNDAGWSAFRTMLRYKCDYAGVWYEEVNESYSTQVCSVCMAKPESSPKGMDGLGIREWKCDGCGIIHDRDVNAARNILALGHGRLAGGSDIKSIKALYAMNTIDDCR